jgi:predicted small lipoprotein YifL
MKNKLRIPEALAVVAISLAGCGKDPNVPQSNLCPPDFYCSSDAARAFNCSDADVRNFTSDFGICYPPV